MNYRLPHSRRYCTVCHRVTNWELDEKINHSRCLSCGSDSRHAERPRREIKEEPKMNKQYVQEQIKNAIQKIRDEYDPKLSNIYQCPDCGAVAFRNSTHICLPARGDSLRSAASPTFVAQKNLIHYVLEVLPTSPPDLNSKLEHDSPYTVRGIEKRIAKMGYPGKISSVGSNISKFYRAGKVNRNSATIVDKIVNKNGREIEREIAGFVYWKGGSLKESP